MGCMTEEKNSFIENSFTAKLFFRLCVLTLTDLSYPRDGKGQGKKDKKQ